MSDHHRRSFCCRMVKARRRRIPQYFRVEDRRDDRLVSENRGRTSEMKTPIGKPELALVLMVFGIFFETTMLLLLVLGDTR